MSGQIALLKNLSRYCKGGEIDVKAGELYLAADEWGKALESLQQGIKKGNLLDPASAYQLLAETYFRLDKQRCAKEALAKATALMECA